MAIDLPKLAAQGRAYSASRPWEPEELSALLLLENERGIGRQLAADYVRNGITTLEAYDRATKVDFKPKTLEDSEKDAEDALKAHGASVAIDKPKAKASKSKK